MNRKTLVIITNADFDSKSGASWSRLLCYSKAFSLNGIAVILTSLNNSFDETNKYTKIENNIFILGNRDSPEKTSKKALPVIKELNICANIKYLRNIHKRFKQYENIKYLLYPYNFALSFTTALYLRAFKKNKVYVEKNELHLAIALNLTLPLGLKKIFYFPALVLQVFLGGLTDFIEIFFDGMICISTRLEKLYKKVYKNLIRIPILANTNRSLKVITNKKSSEFFHICYAGTISENRDGIFSLLKSIALLENRNYNIVCNLYGPMSFSTNKKLRHLISNNYLRNIVRYHGNYSIDKIYKVLKEQDLLVLLRPVNLQTNYGFSTKLAEYMSSGVPVLSTKFSDVSIYLVDGKNGFLIEELNSELLISKLKEILNKRDRLNTIGKEGWVTALKFFNFSNYSKELHDFLFSSN